MADSVLEYVAAVEEFFVATRRKGLMLSPADRHRVEGWHGRGIPLKVVFRGIKEGVECFHSAFGGRRELPRSLGYFRPFVEQLFKRYQERVFVEYTGELDEQLRHERQAVLSRAVAAFERAADRTDDWRLRNAYRKAVAALRSLDPCQTDVYQEIAHARFVACASFLRALERTSRREVAAEARRRLQGDRKRMSRGAYKQRYRRMLLQIAQKRWGFAEEIGEGGHGEL